MFHLLHSSSVCITYVYPIRMSTTVVNDMHQIYIRILLSDHLFVRISRMAKTVEKNRKHNYATMDPNQSAKDFHPGLGLDKPEQLEHPGYTSQANKIHKGIHNLKKSQAYI
ncbi:hypothetical protein YC2023_048824 [Brassica napus]